MVLNDETTRIGRNCTEDVIELKVGGSRIELTSGGIVIKATKVDVKGNAMVAVKEGQTKTN